MAGVGGGGVVCFGVGSIASSVWICPPRYGPSRQGDRGSPKRQSGSARCASSPIPSNDELVERSGPWTWISVDDRNPTSHRNRPADDRRAMRWENEVACT